MRNWTKDLKEGTGLLEKDYSGIVVDDNDPKKCARIKVRVPEIFEGIPDEDLPWAIPFFMHVDGSSPQSGSISIPKIGSEVSIKFQNQDLHYPIYSGFSVNQKTIMPEVLENYPHRSVTKFKNGCIIIIDEKTNEVLFKNPGDVHISIDGNADISVAGNCTQTVQGNQYFQVGGAFVVNSQVFNVNASNVSVSANGDSFFGANGVTAIGGSRVNIGSTGEVGGFSVINTPSVANVFANVQNYAGQIPTEYVVEYIQLDQQVAEIVDGTIATFDVDKYKNVLQNANIESLEDISIMTGVPTDITKKNLQDIIKRMESLNVDGSRQAVLKNLQNITPTKELNNLVTESFSLTETTDFDINNAIEAIKNSKQPFKELENQFYTANQKTVDFLMKTIRTPVETVDSAINSFSAIMTEANNIVYNVDWTIQKYERAVQDIINKIKTLKSNV